MDSDASASMFEGYECKFVQPPPKQFQIECPICLEILREPHIVSCCGYNFCKRCIGRIEGKSCPICKETGYAIMENQSWKRALYDFHVRCPHRHVGCDWTGELRNLLPHLNDNRQTPDLKGCPYTEITCPLCMAKVCRELFEDHQEEQCPQREYTCEYCKEYRATFEDVACQHWELCELFILPCPNNCEMSGNGTKKFIERRKLEHHVNEECPLTPVACALRYAGCTVKLCRKDVTEHMREESSTHLSLLAAENLTLVKKLHDRDERMTQLMKAYSEQQEALLALEKKFAALTSDIARTKKSVHQRSLDQQQEAHLTLERKVTALTSDHLRLQICVDQQQDSHLHILESKVAALTTNLTRTRTIVSDQLRSQTDLSSKVTVAISQAQDLIKKREQDLEVVLELSKKVSNQALELTYLRETTAMQVEVFDAHFKEQQMPSKNFKSIERTVADLMRELSELRKANNHEKEVQHKALIQEKEARRKAHAQEVDIRCQQLKEVCHKLENQATLLKVQENRCEGLTKCVTALQRESAAMQSLPHHSDDHTLEEVRQKEELAKSMSALRQELAESSTALTLDLLQLREAFTQEKSRQEKHLQSLAESVSGLQQDMAAIQSANLLTEQQHIVPFDFKLHDFTKHRNNHLECFSPNFYTHMGGYKLHLCVKPGGFGDGKDTHISLSVHLLSGDFDAHLTFPLQCYVTVMLLNQYTDEHHHQVTIKCSFESRVTMGNVDKGFGLARFFPCTRLNTSVPSGKLRQFVSCDDSISFRIASIKLKHLL